MNLKFILLNSIVTHKFRQYNVSWRHMDHNWYSFPERLVSGDQVLVTGGIFIFWWQIRVNGC
jgi:hypothetical protein